MLRIVRVTGLATVQDLGWLTGRAMGLPPGGAMDPGALQLGNVLVGNDRSAAGIELALGDMEVELEKPAMCAASGSVGAITIDGATFPPDTTVAVAAGGRLSVGRARDGRFGYLAVAGGIATTPTLGSRSTYLPTGLGGFDGRRLAAGDRLPIGPPASSWPAAGTSLPAGDTAATPIRITTAPQGYLFPDEAFSILADRTFRVLPASDRMGTRLEGPPIPINAKATLPSEGTCLGAMQVPDNGQPIVVLRDGPTVGGYPKIAVVIRADLARFCQLPLGAAVAFQWVTVARAEGLRREGERDLRRRLSLARPEATESSAR